MKVYRILVSKRFFVFGNFANHLSRVIKTLHNQDLSLLWAVLKEGRLRCTMSGTQGLLKIMSIGMIGLWRDLDVSCQSLTKGKVMVSEMWRISTSSMMKRVFSWLSSSDRLGLEKLRQGWIRKPWRILCNCFAPTWWLDLISHFSCWIAIHSVTFLMELQSGPIFRHRPFPNLPSRHGRGGAAWSCPR